MIHKITHNIKLFQLTHNTYTMPTCTHKNMIMDVLLFSSSFTSLLSSSLSCLLYLLQTHNDHIKISARMKELQISTDKLKLPNPEISWIETQAKDKYVDHMLKRNLNSKFQKMLPKL